MELALLKGKDPDQTEPPNTNTAPHEKDEKRVDIKYNLRKRKHKNELDAKDKNATTSKQPRATQLERKRPTKDKQSPAIVKRTERRPTKTNDNTLKQLRSPVASQTPKPSTSEREKAQTKSEQKTSKFSELRENLRKRRPRTRKESNKKNKVDKFKFKSKPNSPSKSKTNANSSTELAEKLPKVCHSIKTRRRTTQSPGSSLKGKIQIKSPIESDKNGHARSCKTPTTLSRKTGLKNMTVMSSNQENFSKMFLKKLEIIAHIDGDISLGSIYSICVTNDNLVWVNYYESHVKLFDASGNVLRSVSLKQPPVFNCCTPTGDLLFTQGYAGGARAEVMMVPREGNPRLLADLSSYASNLCGILCQEEKIYIVCCGISSVKHFVIKLDMNGVVEETYETVPQTNINHIVSHHGRLHVIGTHDLSMLPLGPDKVFTSDLGHDKDLTRDISKLVSSKVYSASTCVDNHGNVIMGSESQIYVFDPSLQYLHKIRTNISGSILSTAVDHLGQLWIGTRDLYISKYLK